MEFGIGIPPKALTLWRDKDGTEYTLNWIPLWGFVRLKGEDPTDKETFTAKDSFIQANIFHKILILLGGVLVNFLFAWIVFAVLFMVGIKPITIAPENATAQRNTSYLMPTMSFLVEKGYVDEKDFAVDPTVQALHSEWLWYTIGMRTGDVIKTIDGQSVDSLTITSALQQAIGKEVALQVLRNEEMISLMLPCPEQDCILWVAFQGIEKELPVMKFWFVESWWIALKEMGAQSSHMLYTLGSLGEWLVTFHGKQVKDTLNKFTSPVGAVDVGRTIFMRTWAIGYAAFAAMISLALAVFNLLPIPALDGGRLVGVIIQHVLWLKKETYFTIEGYLNVVFFLLLLLLWVYLIFKDLDQVWWISIF